jgi:hypothetical protein
MTSASDLPILARLNIGVTGHRDLLPEQEAALRAQVSALFERLSADFPDLPLQVISALAEGADQLVAEQALAMGIPVMAPLPMNQAEYERDFQSEEALQRFRALLARCRTQTLPPAPGINPTAIGHEGPERDQQYAQVGVFISSHCQLLLALWDGSPAESGGGTADVVQFHVHERMSAQPWSASTARLPDDKGDDLVYHLPCNRQGNPPAGDSAAPVAAPRWLNSDGSWPGEQPLPYAYREVFERMQAYNRDLRQCADRIAAESVSLLPPAAASGSPRAENRLMRRLDSLFRQSDWLALHYQRLHRRLLFATHALAVSLGLGFILYYNLAPDPWVLAVFLAVFAGGSFWYWFGQRREWHRKYHDYRVLAEGLRVQLYWYLAGIPTDAGIQFAHRSFLRRADRELGWIRQVMRGAALPDDREPTPDDAWLEWVIADWVGAVEAGTGQLAYYRNKIARSKERERHTSRRFAVAAVAVAGLGAALVLLHGRMSLATASFALALFGLLPLIAGLHEADAERRAEQQQTKQYQLMFELLQRAQRQLDVTGDNQQRRRTLRALGEACLMEHTRWLTAHHKPALPMEGKTAAFSDRR